MATPEHALRQNDLSALVPSGGICSVDGVTADRPAAHLASTALRVDRGGLTRRRPALVLAAIGLTTASTLAVLPAGTGLAEPAPTLQQVERRVADLDKQVDLAVEDYQEAQVQLVALRRRSEVAQAEVRRQQAVLDRLREQVGRTAAVAYRSGTAGAGLSLFADTDDPQAYLERATALDRIAARQADDVAAAGVARARLETVVAQAAADLAAQRAVEARAAERRQAIEKTLRDQEALLSSLKEAERRRVLAERAAALEAQRAAQARASRDRTPESSASGSPSATSRSSSPVPSPGAASGRASVAVQAAYSRLGSPYVWGAAGPSTFDCSGLTSWVWAKAGVSLPHSSRAQYASGRKVSRSDIQPGDLVYYGSPIHHVGIYVGGGNMISAPHTGDVVKVQAAFRSDFVGATRP